MTNLKQIMLSVVLMVATATSTIWAQTHVTGSVPVVGSQAHYGGYHSSTAGEGYLRGYADLARSRGMAAAYYSQAAINIETARRQYLENRKLQLEYNRAHAQAREERNHRRREDLARRRATYKRLVAKRNAKDRVDWPTALVGKRYESLRDEIESLVQIRSRR